MSGSNYPYNVSAAENVEKPKAARPIERIHTVVLFSPAVLFASSHTVSGDLSELRLWRVIWSAAFFGAVAVWAGRDGLERLVGALVAVPVLAVGLPALGLVPAGWTLVTTLAAFAAPGVAFVAWQTCRTPAPPKPPSARRVVRMEPAMPLASPVPGRCRWCGLRPRGVICGGRSDGGFCERAEEPIHTAS